MHASRSQPVLGSGSLHPVATQRKLRHMKEAKGAEKRTQMSGVTNLSFVEIKGS